MTDTIIESIKSNPNLPELVKDHIATFVGALKEALPEYNYDDFGKVLSTIKFKEGSVNSDDYSSYDEATNTLILDKKRALEDGIDMQHLIFNQILSICVGRGE
ncbi:MAG TPA: hypothetical protein PLC53_00690 [Bacilli bacterium]|nr:hypothetical protein [Bacilli bacterium]